MKRSELLVRVVVVYAVNFSKNTLACMRFSRAVMFSSLRFQNIENYVSLTFSFVYLLASNVQGKEGCNIACVA